jgi:hypothetical protein
MYKNVCVVLLLMIASSAFASRQIRPVRIQTESEMLGLCEGNYLLLLTTLRALCIVLQKKIMPAEITPVR